MMKERGFLSAQPLKIVSLVFSMLLEQANACRA